MIQLSKSQTVRPAANGDSTSVDGPEDSQVPGAPGALAAGSPDNRNQGGSFGIVPRAGANPTADAVVIFAATDEVPWESEAFECRLARSLAKRLPVVFVPGIGSVRSPRGVFERLRSVVRKPERDPSGALIVRSHLLPELSRGGLQLSGHLLARQLERVLGRARWVTPAALVCHPRGAHALARESWSGVVYAPNERDLRLPVPPDELLAGDSRLRSGSDLVLNLEALGLAGSGQPITRSAPPSRLVRALSDLPRPLILPTGPLDAPELDTELLVRTAERLDLGTLLVPYGRAGALVERLDEIDRVRVAPGETEELLSIADVAIAPFDCAQQLSLGRMEDLLAVLLRGLPTVSTRFPGSEVLGELVRAAHDPAGFASSVRAAAQERDDSLMTRRKLRAGEVRWSQVEARILEALRVPTDAS